MARFMSNSDTQREQFWRDGYVILSDVVPPTLLESMRDTIQTIVSALSLRPVGTHWMS